HLAKGGLPRLENLRRADGAIGLGADGGLLEKIEDTQESVLHTARFFVVPRDLLCIGDSRWQCRWIGRRSGAREITIHELIEERLPQAVHRAVASPAIEVVEDADAVLGQEVELSVEKHRIATVADHRVAILLIEEKSVRHRAEP